MTCEEMEMRLPEFWNRTLNFEDQVAVQEHLAGCDACRVEAERLEPLWQQMAELPIPEPDGGLRERFHEKLAAYRDGAVSSAGSTSSASSLGWVWQIAAGVGLLLSGVGAGYSFHASQTANAEVTQLRGEVGNMRQLVALSLLQQQSASERLRGVSWAYRVEPSDTEVLAALLTAVNHDPNVNVRLAAVDALHPFAASPVTRDALIQALRKQTTAPIVQVALIDLLVDLKEAEAAPELQRVAMDDATDVGVRQRAQWALERLQ